MTHEKKIWKGIASILLSLAIVLGIMPGMNLSVFADATFYGGSGTADAPYLITSAEDWNALATSVNSGTSYSGVYFKLTNDITVSSMIGTNSHPDLINSHPFSGTFDGDGHTLNLSISSSSTHGAAPFSATNNATIKNLNVTGSVVGGIHSSGLVGVPNGTLTVENCTISAAVSGSTHHGGIVGHAFNATVNLNSCTFDGSLTGGTALGGMIGWSGLSSSSRPTIRLTDCLFSGTYSGGAFDPVGYTATSGDSATLTDFYTTKVRSGNANYPLTTSGTINRAYTINFVNEGGTSLQSSIVRNGQTPSYTGETPSKPADAQYTYTFAGWTPEIAAVTGEATYTATYTSTVNKYTITFENYDGTELQSSEVAYGETPSYTGETPSKPADAQYTYTFAGWTPEIAAVTGDATYTATYSSTVNEYTITFVNEDGTELQRSSVAYGETPAYNGGTPTKPSTAQYTYNFAGWDNEIAAVTGDATYTATYTSTVNEYTIRFVNDDGTELQSSEVAYGETPSYTGATPTRAADAQYTYTFDDWNEAIVPVTGDATYTATYTSTVNEYTIRFVNDDGTELQSSSVAYGETPVYNGETPTKDATAQYTYTYAGWDAEIIAVTGDATYTATYTNTVNNYTVTFNTNGGNAIDDQVVNYNDTATRPADPTKAGYTFAGWYQDATLSVAFDYSTPITADTTIYAKWTENPVVPTAYMVYFNTDGGSEISAQVVAAGGTATKPADPTKEGYTFAGWYQDATLNIAFNFDTAITSDVALYAKWTENTEPDQVVYNIISGANAVWSQGEYVLTVRRDVNDETCYSHFTGVQIDGITLVAGTDYTAAPGSTVITFKAETMERLSLGSHTITVLFDDGRVETTLTKQQAGTNSSTTGAIASTGEDVSKNIIAAVICFVVSGLMLGIALIEKRKLYS